MGANVFFIAFREAPDTEALARIPGLGGYRLFRHSSRAEWYLEGPSPDGDDITFFEPIDHDRKAEGLAQAKVAVKKFLDVLAEAKLKPYGVSNEALAAALSIGNALGLATLLVDSNDDGVDAGYICEAGEVSYARLPSRSNGVIAFERGTAREESPKSDTVEYGEPVLDLHQFATEVANTFFGQVIRWRVTSDPFEFKAAEYTLVSSRGQRDAFRPQGADIKDALWAIESGQDSGRVKLRKMLAITDRHVTAALQERLIMAPRADRDSLEANVSNCLLHASLFRSQPSPALGLVATYLGRVLAYMSYLRPKPDFRKKINFRAMARWLRFEWRILKLRLLFAKL